MGAPVARVVERATNGGDITGGASSERGRVGATRDDGESSYPKLGEALDTFDERAEPLFYREGEVWRSVVGKSSRFGALWFGVLGLAQALVRVLISPTWPNFFEAIADGTILTLIVAPAGAAAATFVYECWCSFQLRLLAPFLPYTLSPYSSKNPSAKVRDELVRKAMNSRRVHRRFARIKAARTFASEVCAQFATAAVEAPRRALAVALALKAFSIINVSTNTVLDSLLCATLVLSSVTVNLLERRRGPQRMLKEMCFVEEEYLKAQTKGTFLCRWAFDPYEDPAGLNLTSEHKRLTNAAVADALAASCDASGITPETSMALVLDAADGRTSKELMSVGIPKTSIWVPNLYTHVVHALRKRVGVNAVATKVEAFLAARDPRATQLQLIYLDHCGAVDNRTQQIFDVFSRHAIADGGVIAVTFSTRGKRSGNSKATSVQLAAKALVEAAEVHGYTLEGDAAPNVAGLVDYTVAVRPELGGDAQRSSEYAKVADALRKSANAIEASLVADNDGMIASSLALWLKDSEPKDESDEALETGKDRRRRRLTKDLSGRVLKRLAAGEKTLQADGRAMRSLAREVVVSARAAADLRDPLNVQFVADVSAERTYSKCLYLYKTLMFFVFRVRVAS
ncbi:hypothetical protein BE221DRAFT_213317 [Ostreococcus tauri]|uniref:Uncharacterized protein n=1 Tax=Ostreococcus tauri TaxID=70448 RepID=A0A1Y5I897_OSTTA|nr:hypothetical protein BE221DRAFT_213317 [Ostreococcus tauri]